jgi:hypothetical protein
MAEMLRKILGLLDLSKSGGQLVRGLLLIGHFILLCRGKFLKVDGKWEKCVELFGGAQFYSSREELCQAKHVKMVGLVLSGDKSNQFVRNEIRYQFATGSAVLWPVRGLAWIHLANRIHKTNPWEPMSRIQINDGVGININMSFISKGTAQVSKLMC